MVVYDLSPTLSPRTGVFPGDVAFRRDVSMSFSKGHHLALSSVTTTLHIGSHADAVSHYSAEGGGIDQIQLSRYIGPAVVVRANIERGHRVSFRDLSSFGREWIEKAEASREAQATQNAGRGVAKFLLWTGTFPDPNSWNSDFASYDPELISRLHAVGIVLIGIDTPSIDPETSKELESHHTIEKFNMSVLEGLCLNGVPEGVFWMIAPPLKIEGADAGPVRALLFDSPETFPEIAHLTSVACEEKP